MSEYGRNGESQLESKEGYPAYPLILLLILPPVLSLGLPEMVEYWLPAAGGCYIETLVSTVWLVPESLGALVGAVSDVLIMWIVPGTWFVVCAIDLLRMVRIEPPTRTLSAEIARHALVFSGLALVPGVLAVLGCNPTVGGM